MRIRIDPHLVTVSLVLLIVGTLSVLPVVAQPEDSVRVFLPSVVTKPLNIALYVEDGSLSRIEVITLDGPSRRSEARYSCDTPRWAPGAPMLACRMTVCERVGCFHEGVFVVGRDGMLTSLDNDYNYPNWSPDAQRIVLGGTMLVTMRPDGSERTTLLGVGDSTFREPLWSPDGAQIAFLQSPRTLHTISASGGAPTAIAINVLKYHWSPNGRHLAVVRQDGQGGEELTLFETTTETFTPVATAASIWDVTWSSDSLFLGFRVWEATSGIEVHLLEVGEGESQILGPGHSPSWSPDGQRLAYLGPVNLDGSPGLQIVDRDTGARVEVPNEGHFTWSPDSRYIALVDVNGLAIIEVDGDGMQQIDVTQAQDLSWSPEGSWLVFTAELQENQGRRLLAVRYNGSSLRELAAVEGGAPYFQWLP
jgi:Tol biopolymer transport system component